MQIKNNIFLLHFYIFLFISMGVDYYVCDHCGESYPDCGDYRH